METTGETVDRGVIEKTARLMSQARQLLAYGGLDGVLQRPLYYDETHVFPHFAVSADGYEIVDSTGQSYIDWVNGWGPALLGYNHPQVNQAICDQLNAGPTLSLMHPIEIEVAELICEMVPCADMVAFGKNGSDAIAAAIRIARATTNREIIFHCGSHGFHDWYVCQQPEVKGIPRVLRDLVVPFPYNDFVALEKLFAKYRNRVAGVIMEPVNMTMPGEGFLEATRELARQHGALMIFNEMVTAFRLAVGGAQETFGVVPDLACLGKGMANGMPLSAVVGDREYMQYLPRCGFGMTFRGETLSLAAAKKTLQIIRDQNVPEHLAQTGEAIRHGFHELCREHGVGCHLSGPPSRLTFVFQDDQGGLSWQELRELFLQECLKNGVLTNGNLLASFAHDQTAVQRTLAAFGMALRSVANALHTGDRRSIQPADEPTYIPPVLTSNGFLEEIYESSESLHITGWMLLPNGCPDSIQIESVQGHVINADAVSRHDLAEAFPSVRGADRAGYSAELNSDQFADGSAYQFTINAMRNNKTAFRCLVRLQCGLDKDQLVGPFWTGDGVLYI